MATRKRRRLSSVDLLPEDQRAYVEQVIRRRDLTLDDMLADIRAKFPGEPAAEISRSAVHRYSVQFEEMTGRMREIQTMAEAVVGEIGEGVGEKAGALLTQAIITLATNAALKAHGDDQISIETIRKLSVAARNAIDTQRVDLNVRKAIKEAARDELVREQRQKLDKLGKSGAISPEALQAVIKAAYDL